MSSASIRTTETQVVVLKLGGSVLIDLAAYRRCAAHLHQLQIAAPHERLLAVVSAQYGQTDRLLALAQNCTPQPNPRTLDLLWTTGEQQSVALLTLCLQALGIDAAGLMVHQCGLEVADASGKAEVVVNPLPLLYQLRRHPIVVVPGFFARAPGDVVVSLGRGGSDLTAVLLAAGLGALRCELVKDVPGYFSKDPHRFADAQPLEDITFERALSMAAEGCDLVQERALRAAQRADLPLVIRALGHGHKTVVHSQAESADGARAFRAAV